MEIHSVNSVPIWADKPLEVMREEIMPAIAKFEVVSECVVTKLKLREYRHTSERGSVVLSRYGLEVKVAVPCTLSSSVEQRLVDQFEAGKEGETNAS